MLICSYNVNGLKSSINKGLLENLKNINPDIICLQEIKCQEIILELKGYYSYWNFSDKKSYSGTAVFVKQKPIKMSKFDNIDFNFEGRIIALEYENFFLINVYVPNSRSGINRIDYRMKWDEIFIDIIDDLNIIKPVIICGDFNVTTNKIIEDDFINNELDEFYNLLENGFIDAFKYQYPNNDGYTWWQIGKKGENKGYRLDYFIVSNYFKNKIKNIKIYNEVNCSDHCPISLEMDI